MENRLYEIKRKGAKDEKKSTLEEKWLQDMEEKAMSDYRKKDLGNNSDLTAKIFNQKRAERDAEEEGEECDRYVKVRNCQKEIVVSSSLPKVNQKFSPYLVTNALSFYGSKTILDRPNHFGRVAIILDRSNSFWSGSNHTN